jgi:hypothetical protein
MRSTHQEDFSKIILAVDGSEHSAAATYYLDRLPISPNCNICILAVLIHRIHQGNSCY